jgi:hypothetical protein
MFTNVTVTPETVHTFVVILANDTVPPLVDVPLTVNGASLIAFVVGTVTEIVCDAPPAIAVGAVLVRSVPPLPIWPLSPRPQQYARPVEVRAHAKSVPTPTETTSFIPDAVEVTFTGTCSCDTPAVLFPICP